MSKNKNVQETVLIPIGDIKPNPSNPRYIKDDQFIKLVNSIKQFPEMLKIRPIVLNKEMIALGGNMRLKAATEAGLTEIPCIIVDLTPEQEKEFIIKDNVGFGEWDWDQLANQWEEVDLLDWGLVIPNFKSSDDVDFSEKNREVDIDALEEKVTINLKYTFDEYKKVKSKLLEIAPTPEQAVWLLLKIDEEHV